VSLPAGDFGNKYRAAFEAYMHESGEGGLSAAYELGRDAVRKDVSVLDLAAIHHDALADALRAKGEPHQAEGDVRIAGGFLLESLSAFEVAQRVLQENREAALVDMRHAGMLRRLSSFLADASLALDATGSVEEMLQLVAENARELAGARWAAARLHADAEAAAVEAVACSAPGDESAKRDEAAEFAARFAAIRPDGGSLRRASPELAAQSASRHRAEDGEGGAILGGWLAASLTKLDGREIGLIQVFDKENGGFSDLDEAVVLQVAQMTAAAVERAQRYRHER
jgi:hypothetical protein